MAKVRIKRNFDFLLCGIEIKIDDKICKLGLWGSDILEVNDGGHHLEVDAMGYYSSSKEVNIDRDMTIEIRPILPLWFYLSFLSAMCLSITLGLLGLVPNILGSSLLLFFVIVVSIASTVKRKSFFKINASKFL